MIWCHLKGNISQDVGGKAPQAGQVTCVCGGLVFGWPLRSTAIAMQTILLSTDLSCRCDRALDRAAALALERHARLVVVHALPPLDQSENMPSWQRPRDAARVATEQVNRDLRNFPGLDFEVIVERGEPATLVLEICERLGCTLVVTGVARNETLGRMLLGTTVTNLARKCPVPLLVIKSRPHESYQNVLVATDFSANSRHALDTALTLFPKAKTSVFHSIETSLEGLVDDKSVMREAAAEQAQFDMKCQLSAAGVWNSHVTPICEHGEIGETLHDLIEKRQFDLLVIGTKGRGFLSELLLGSVAKYLLNNLPVDMLVVRGDGKGATALS
jgi:nucleotide-binding universal stress UspA family protein